MKPANFKINGTLQNRREESFVNCAAFSLLIVKLIQIGGIMSKLLILLGFVSIFAITACGEQEERASEDFDAWCILDPLACAV